MQCEAYPVGTPLAITLFGDIELDGRSGKDAIDVGALCEACRKVEEDVHRAQPRAWVGLHKAELLCLAHGHHLT